MKNVTRETIGDRLTTLLSRHAGEHVTVTPESTITGDLGLDSVALMEILAEVEDQLGLRVPDEELPELRTVGDVICALERHCNDKKDHSR